MISGLLLVIPLVVLLALPLVLVAWGFSARRHTRSRLAVALAVVLVHAALTVYLAVAWADAGASGTMYFDPRWFAVWVAPELILAAGFAVAALASEVWILGAAVWRFTVVLAVIWCAYLPYSDGTTNHVLRGVPGLCAIARCQPADGS